MQWRNRIIIIFICSVFISCVKENKNSVESEPSFEEEHADFISFYEKFHGDSLYQVNHIRFPLQGQPSQIDSTFDENTFRWTKDEWIIHRGLDKDESEFKQSFTAPMENMIIDRIFTPDKAFVMERRFSKMGSDWYLIYFQDLQAKGF